MGTAFSPEEETNFLGDFLDEVDDILSSSTTIILGGRCLALGGSDGELERGFADCGLL